MKDVDVLRKIHWKALILDDAHRLENRKTRLFEERASISRDFCILLTGTPLQKLAEELWALIYFADPITFKSREKHLSNKFGDLPDAKQISGLHTVHCPQVVSSNINRLGCQRDSISAAKDPSALSQETWGWRNQAYDISVTPEQQKLNTRRLYKLSAEAVSTSKTYFMPVMAAFHSTAK
jgi:SNF2-related domain